MIYPSGFDREHEIAMTRQAKKVSPIDRLLFWQRVCGIGMVVGWSIVVIGMIIRLIYK